MQGACAGTGGVSSSAALRFLSSPSPSRISIRVSSIFFPNTVQISSHNNVPHLYTALPSPAHRKSAVRATSSPSSVGSEPYAEEPATKVKFSTSATFPGCSSPLSLLGTGHREKVFAIIGVKVYAAGFYMNPSLIAELNPGKGKSHSDITGDGSLFSSIFQGSFEKSLQIVLVRDIDGKTFWDALDEAISPRIKTLTSTDESALLTFRSIFQGRPLKKGTIILLTWSGKSKMLVSASSDGLPSKVDAEIVSENVTSALFDVFLGDSPVSPSLKASVVDGLVKILK